MLLISHMFIPKYKQVLSKIYLNFQVDLPIQPFLHKFFTNLVKKLAWSLVTAGQPLYLDTNSNEGVYISVIWFILSLQHITSIAYSPIVCLFLPLTPSHLDQPTQEHFRHS